MRSFLNRLFGWLLGRRKSRIVCDEDVWMAGAAELEAPDARREQGKWSLPDRRSAREGAQDHSEVRLLRRH